jgi:hypothetical protein
MKTMGNRDRYQASRRQIPSTEPNSLLAGIRKVVGNTPQSSLSACMGSIDAALRVGRNADVNPTATSSNETAT